MGYIVDSCGPCLPIIKKCEVEVYGRQEGGQPWAEFPEPRDLHGVTADQTRFNRMPQGIEQMAEFAGEEVVQTATQTQMNNGFSVGQMSPFDDYCATTFNEDVGGFILRNNYRDRA